MVMKDRVKELRRVPASELRANPKNWRTHPPAQEAAMRGVLEDIGFADAMIARETPDGLELIDGHLRQEVMGDQPVPVLIVDVTEEEADKMLLTLDPLAMMAHADQDQLLHLLRDTQFESQAVNDMLEAVANGERLPMPDLTEPVDDPGPEIDRAEELREKWQTERGQVWEVGRHRLMCGDATKKEQVESLTQGIVTGMLADPPYNVGLEYTEETDDKRDESVFWEWQQSWFTLGAGITERQIVTPGCVNLERWLKHFPPKHVCIWDKGEGANTHGRVTKYWAWEPIMCSGHFQRRRHTDVFRLSALGINPGHPTPKPIGLWKEIIESFLPDDSLYDPFLGSGTTMVAAEQLGRICYGMEIEPKYVAVTLERMSGMGLEPKLVTG